ncbi:hypothetical protein BKA93DRAFT_759621 [Sparassis latifolia]
MPRRAPVRHTQSRISGSTTSYSAVATPLAKAKTQWQEADTDTDVDRRYRQYAQSAKRIMIGPMPVDAFLNFLPETDMSMMPPPAQAFSNVPDGAEYRHQIIEPLTAALNGVGMGPARSERCPGFIFKDTSTFGKNRGEIGSMVPHISCFSEQVVGLAQQRLAVASHADLYIEVQPQSELDAFTDPACDADRSSHSFFLNIDEKRTRQRAERSLGRNIACATEVCARQHRSFYFSLALSGSRARLIRWDRAGAIISESIDLHCDAEPICEFLWRYAHASQSQRGYDTTVQPATKVEERLFKESITRMVRFQLNLSSRTSLAAAVEEHYQRGIVAAVTVVDDSSVEHRLLVSRPVTRLGYWAVNADSGQVVFLKDTWRWNGKRQMEGEILADLHAAGVHNIPRLICHGDVKEARTRTHEIDQVEGPENSNFEAVKRTQTDRFCQARWVGENLASFHPRVHYRLVLGTVGYGLERFRGAQELLHATYDVYDSMHCDISLGNIILSRDPDSTGVVRSGYLIDWEISSLVTSEGTARDCAPGTFQFMSQRLLRQTPAAHAIQDDMESLLYVVLYCSLLWLDHNQSLLNLTSLVGAIFGRYRTFDHAEEFRSSGSRLSNQYYRIYTSEVRFSNAAVQEWLDAVMDFDSAYMIQYPRDTTLAKVWENPAEFNAFWTNFLSNHAISNCDRVPRQLGPPPEVCIDSSSSVLLSATPAPSTLLPRKRRAKDELVRTDAEGIIVVSASSLPRPDYTGPTTRSMVKRSRIKALEAPKSNPRCLRPRSAKP